MKETLNNLRKMLCDELDEIARKPEMSAGDLEAIHKLTDTIKNIDKIRILEEEGGYSQAGDWEARGRFMPGGDSYRGRKRDSMGRYSRDDGKHEIIKYLEERLDEVDNEKEHDAIRRCIDTMRNA